MTEPPGASNPAGGVPAGAGLIGARRWAWIGAGARNPPGVTPNRPMEEPQMTDPTAATRQIEISDQAYDVLARTAASRDTDINGALLYLLEVPPVSAAPADGDEDDD